MIVAITGGSGFIGRKLVRSYLEEGAEVRLLTRRPTDHHPRGVQLHDGDLTGAVGPLERFVDGADILYHCAAEVVDESRMQAVNEDGTRQLCRAAAQRIGRWVQLSSIGIYDTRGTAHVTEETPEGPVGRYETTKLGADRFVEEAGRAGWFSYTILRPSIVYGPTMPNRSLYGLIDMVDRGLFFFIGSPGASANYIHADNVIAALRLCGTLPRAKGRIYNLSDYRTLESFVGTIANHLGRRGPTLRLPKWLALGGAKFFSWLPGTPLTVSRVAALTGCTFFPSERIGRELGYRHVVTMEDGLREMVAAWRQIKRT